MYWSKSAFYFFLIFLGISCSSDYEKVTQLIEISSMDLVAGRISNAEYYISVYEYPTDSSHFPISEFALGLRVSEWSDYGDDVENSNEYESQNTIVEVSITSDSALVSPDSIYSPGQDLSTVFRTTGLSGYLFTNGLGPVDDLEGRKLDFEGLTFVLKPRLEKEIFQRFIVQITMDDGQVFDLESNLVRSAPD